MKKLTRVFCVLCTAIFLCPFLLSCFVTTVSAQNAQSHEFTEKLFKFEEVEFSYAVPQEYTNSITAKTGADDYFKTRFATGDSISSYKSDSQLFENGRYEKGRFIYDQKALAGHISNALLIYQGLEDDLSGSECARIRSLIAYGYSKLSAEGRISIQDSPQWLLADMGEAHTVMQEKLQISSNSDNAPTLLTDGIRKIDAEKSGYRNTVLADSESCDAFYIEVPREAEMFSAVLGISLGQKAADTLVKITLLDTFGRAIKQSDVYLCESYEAPVCIFVKDCARLCFEIYSKESTDVLLCDPIFMKKGSESFSAQKGDCCEDKFGDINCDGAVSSLDTLMLKNAVVSNTLLDFEYCDISRDGVLDFYDVLSLENYIIFLANRYREFSVEAPALNGVSVFDSDCFSLNDKITEQSKLNIKFDSFQTEDFFTLLSKGDSALENSINKAQLVTLSVGYDAFEKAVKEHFKKELSAELSSLSDIPALLAKRSYGELSEFFDEDASCKTFEEMGGQHAERVLEALERIRQINPSAEIVVTEIPVSFASSKLYHTVQIQGVASFESEICSFDKVGDRWLGSFTKELSKALEGMENLHYADDIENSSENSLMICMPRVSLNSLQNGDFTQFESFDIRLSQKGKQLLSLEICTLLADSITKWQSELISPAPEKLPYKFSETFADKKINMSTEVRAVSENEIVYKLTVDKTNELQNLLVNLEYNSKLLDFKSVECELTPSAQGEGEKGVLKILYDGSQDFEGSLEIKVTFKVQPTDGENELKFTVNAAESRMTAVGHSRALSSDSLTVKTDALREELSKNNTDTTLDILENNKTKGSGRVIVYTLFALAFAAVAICIVYALVSAKNNKK